MSSFIEREGKMKPPIRILHQVAGIGSGGVESLLVNLHRNIDKSLVQFDYVLSYDWGKGYYQEEIKKLGGRIYQLPEGGLIKQLFYFFIFLRKHPEYSIIHTHRGALGSLFLLVALMAGKKNRICHSHYASRSEKFVAFMTEIMKPVVKIVSTKKFACGTGAGDYLYGKSNYEILKNSIDLSKFAYPGCRLEKRLRLGFSENEIVYGHVGRFNEQKNSLFVIDVFNEIYKKQRNARLLMIGDGELIDDCKRRVREYEIDDLVTILSNRSDVNELLQVMDMIVFPSRYEGFSLAMIEMQAASLRILTSDMVSSDINLTGDVYFKSLEDSAESWAKEAIRLSKYDRNSVNRSVLYQQGYDIKMEAMKLQRFYLSLVGRDSYII